MNTIFKEIIKEICLEEKIEYKFLSKDWITMLSKNNNTRFISGYKFDLNGHGIGNTIDDKYAFYEVLKMKNIDVIDHEIIFNNSNNNSYAKDNNNYELVYKLFNKYNNHIVIKSNTGTCGTEVYNIDDSNKIYNCLNSLFKNNFSISVCPFYNIKTEYRFIILNNEVLLSYAKKRPIIIGDGISTIKELLDKFNHEYFKDKLNNYIYNEILPVGKSFEYSWQFNLSQGSIPFLINDYNLFNNLKDLALKVSKEINLGFGSIDIIETDDNKLLVLEANSGVMMDNYVLHMKDGYKQAKEVYKKAILQMFKKR